MRKLHRHGNQETKVLGRRAKTQTLRAEASRREEPASPSATPGTGSMKKMTGDIYKRLRSIFGAVPTFLERTDEIRAILTYRPSDLQT
jgi:hypothetical protein